MKELRKWCDENEGLFRLVEVIGILFVGLWLSYLQVGISQKQTEVAEKSLEVSKAELELVDLQTQLAKIDHNPYFTFQMSDLGENSSNPILWCSNRSGEVRYLKGQAKVYITFKSDSGKIRKILIDNFFDRVMNSPEKGEVTFSYTAALTHGRLLGCEVSDAKKDNGEPKFDKDYAERHVRWPEQFPQPFDVFIYVGVSYVAEDGRDRRLHYDMQLPTEFARPLVNEPQYDATVNVKKFRKSEHVYDLDAIRREVESAMASLRKG